MTQGVQDAGEGTDRQGARGAEDGVLAVGVDDHLRGDQPTAGPQHRGGHGPEDPIDPTHRNRQRLGHADSGTADGAHGHQAGRVGVIADGAGTDGQTHGQTRCRGADPAQPTGGLDPADDGLDGAEHDTADQATDGRRTESVDVAGDGPRRHAGQREPDEGPQPSGPPLGSRAVGHRCLPLGSRAVVLAGIDGEGSS